MAWSQARNLIALDKAGDDGSFDVYTMRPDGTDLRCLTCGKSGAPEYIRGGAVAADFDWGPGIW